MILEKFKWLYPECQKCLGRGNWDCKYDGNPCTGPRNDQCLLMIVTTILQNEEEYIDKKIERYVSSSPLMGDSPEITEEWKKRIPGDVKEYREMLIDDYTTDPLGNERFIKDIRREIEWFETKNDTQWTPEEPLLIIKEEIIKRHGKL